MTKMIKLITAPLYSLVILMGLTSVGHAETTVSAEVGFIFNTLLFLICGFLVMFMAAGFAMLESGMVTSKSVSVICAKNIGLYAIAGIMFWLVGFLCLPYQCESQAPPFYSFSVFFPKGKHSQS